ncbi:aldo/keto reductase, partial [Vibrio parahaemolyticus]
QRAVPGRAPLVSSQVRYSLLDRGVEREVIPACQELGLGILPYSPLGGGVL